MKKAYIFPGQGSQSPGMGKELFDHSSRARVLFEKANEILDFDISKIMFYGTTEELKQTKITQPAIFLHSVIAVLSSDNFFPDMVAGHSLGEFSALVANGVLTFEDGLKLVLKRAMSMQLACELEPSTMAAILGLDDEKVEEICKAIPETVVPANYNCPGQIVISGSVKGIELACIKLKEAGAKRALILPVGGAFHSPLMAPAGAELAQAIKNTPFSVPSCPIFQNVNALPTKDIEIIKQNLIDQLTGPVKWTQTVRNMVAAGATSFIECGPGKVLQGLVKKINSESEILSI